MKNAVVVHGWGANSKSNWFPWLKQELVKKGFQVMVPDFPNTDNPVLTEWLEYFSQACSVNQDTILIGHSLGVPFILRFLENLKEGRTIKAACLVAGFERSVGDPETDNFVNRPFSWKRIRSACGRFVVVNSDNDPYIPLQIGYDLAKSLETKLIVEPNGGHLNAPGGFLSYPRLLKKVLSET
jgi:predicted alpha/beta hydrolase family esterase